MRPHSDIRLALASELVSGPGTCRELYQRIGCAWPLQRVRIGLTNMVAAGQVRVSATVRVEGVCRPVPVYARATAEAPHRKTPHTAMQTLIDCWAGLRSPAHTEACM